MYKQGTVLNFQKIPFVKEWGSWAVFIYACSTGLIAGLQTRPWQTGNDFSLRTLATILGLVFLLNAKAPLASFLRAGENRKEHLGWLLFFSLTGLALLMPFLIDGTMIFLVSFLLVITYLVFVLNGKEHSLFAELNGFALLTLSAPIVYYVITSDVSWRLYAAVLVFFSAGVLKVRVRLKKTAPYRILMVLYCTAAPLLFYFLKIPVILLLPHFENIISALLMKEERLRATGNIELIKGAVFLFLTGFFWE
ncbi:MAG: YwiC-like family protein [Nitrospira sp.]|nr:YwiC-like family protein [Nitrospira sp.]